VKGASDSCGIESGRLDFLDAAKRYDGLNNL